MASRTSSPSLPSGPSFARSARLSAHSTVASGERLPLLRGDRALVVRSAGAHTYRRQAEARDLELRATVHDHFEARRFSPRGGFLIHHSDLHPHGLGADEDSLVDRLAGGLRAAEDVDDVDGYA